MAVPVEDASGYSGYADEILAPSSESEIVEILRRAESSRTPVTVSGGGTGVTGGRVPSGGWLLSLERLNGIEIHPGFAVAGPGALLRDLHRAAAAGRQFFAPDPTEWTASVGGAIANNASGSRSFRYGDTRRHLLRLRVVFIGGRVIEVRRGDQVDFPVPALPLPATTKHTAGYRLAPGMDWIDLIAGSEGTLGVVTEAELRLLPSPADLLTGVVFFTGDEDALAAVDAWRAVESLRMLEYMDRRSLDLLRDRFAEIPAAAGAALLIEQELSADDGGSAAAAWLDRMEHSGALAEDSWFASSPADRERFRRFRHALPETVNDLVRQNGLTKLGSDYAVPLARNREMLAEYRTCLERDFPGRYVIFGHIGDAHLHANILPRSSEEYERGRRLMTHFARVAVSLGGTVSAEHGLGKRKAHLLELQYDAAGIAAMKEVKGRLDPYWLLGRGNLFAHEAGS